MKLVPDSNNKDAEILESALNAIKWHSSINVSEIKMKVKDGWVTFEGELEWDFQRKSLQIIVEQLQGIEGITNNIKISSKNNHDNIIDKISSAIKRNPSLANKKINIVVKENNVTLKGKVNSASEKLAIEKIAWFASDGKKIENNLIVDPTVCD